MNELEPNEEKLKYNYYNCKMCLARIKDLDLLEGYCKSCIDKSVTCLNELLAKGWIKEENVS